MENYKIKIARYLLQSKAIKLQPSNPFTWASGWKSPIYCDNRLTLSFPEIRNYIRDCFCDIIVEKGNIDVIAGVATGGIPQGAIVADKLNLPFVYVRASAKGHGLENKVEGVVTKGSRVMIIEDLVSTGGSSLAALSSLREAGFEATDMCAVFTYGFPVATENFKKADCILHALSNYEVLLEEALRSGYIKNTHLDILKEWRKDPGNWMKNMQL